MVLKFSRLLYRYNLSLFLFFLRLISSTTILNRQNLKQSRCRHYIKSKLLRIKKILEKQCKILGVKLAHTEIQTYFQAVSFSGVDEFGILEFPLNMPNIDELITEWSKLTWNVVRASSPHEYFERPKRY